MCIVSWNPWKHLLYVFVWSQNSHERTDVDFQGYFVILLATLPMGWFHGMAKNC
jgi:hypothetical protein